ncbi:histone-fold-containing protein [Teratosphaeria nubilosa]|uniref:DNA polymerase epsilon subunit D n=1 Tax=Teratosphaeria nubilosa TaxID=161662 RepID=A0A6G1LFK3_9PEZI|nr:histone-fold-containing protein [Teratosphaeria nubilosa]
MPSRKSNVSTTSNGVEEGVDETPTRQTKEKEKEKEKDGLSIEDLTLPKSMVARLAKGVLPANTQIHKDALLALHKSATVFVNYIASQSSDNAQSSGKKTILPQDVLASLKDAEFENFLPRLEAELKKYNDIQCDKRNTYRKKVKDDKAAAAEKETPSEGGPNGESAAATANGATTNGHTEGENGERPAKKLKGDTGQSVVRDADDETSRQDEDDHDEDVDDDDDGDEDGADNDDDAEDEAQDEDAADDVEEERGEVRDEALDGSDSD